MRDGRAVAPGCKRLKNYLFFTLIRIYLFPDHSSRKIGSSDPENWIDRSRELDRAIPSPGSNDTHIVQSGCFVISLGLFRQYSRAILTL